jgi:hypothetical protein
MTAPQLTAYVIPSGGVISLTINGAVSGAALLERAVSGQAFSPLYSGSAQALYIDAGDFLPAPLDPTKFYQYRYTDITGTTTTPFIQPASTLAVQPEPIIELLIRLIQGGINSLTLPVGIKKAEVTQAMPLGGSINMPLVVINNDLTQQGAVPIGQSVAPTPAIDTPDGSIPGFTFVGFAKRTFRVSVLSANAIERNFYSDLIVGIFESSYQYILQPLGMDVTHSWQVSRGQVATDRLGKAPGFYYSDAVLSFEGTLNVTFMPTYGIITKITTTAVTDDGVETVTRVPLGA